MLWCPLLVALLSTASAYFGPGQFWTIVAVGLVLIGWLGTWVTRLKLKSREKGENSLNLYIAFVDDLQVELKRLHDLLTEERQECAASIRDRDLVIVKLQQKIGELEDESF